MKRFVIIRRDLANPAINSHLMSLRLLSLVDAYRTRASMADFYPGHRFEVAVATKADRRTIRRAEQHGIATKGKADG